MGNATADYLRSRISEIKVSRFGAAIGSKRDIKMHTQSKYKFALLHMKP